MNEPTSSNCCFTIYHHCFSSIFYHATPSTFREPQNGSVAISVDAAISPEHQPLLGAQNAQLLTPGTMGKCQALARLPGHQQPVSAGMPALRIGWPRYHFLMKPPLQSRPPFPGLSQDLTQLVCPNPGRHFSAGEASPGAGVSPPPWAGMLLPSPNCQTPRRQLRGGRRKQRCAEPLRGFALFFCTTKVKFSAGNSFHINTHTLHVHKAAPQRGSHSFSPYIMPNNQE